MQFSDFKFLFDLWYNPDVMRNADDFPKMKGWSKFDTPQAAWIKYKQKRAIFITSTDVAIVTSFHTHKSYRLNLKS